MEKIHIPPRFWVAKDYCLSGSFICRANSDINVPARIIFFADMHSLNMKLSVDFTLSSLLWTLSSTNFKTSVFIIFLQFLVRHNRNQSSKSLASYLKFPGQDKHSNKGIITDPIGSLQITAESHQSLALYICAVLLKKISVFSVLSVVHIVSEYEYLRKSIFTQWYKSKEKSLPILC